MSVVKWMDHGAAESCLSTSNRMLKKPFLWLFQLGKTKVRFCLSSIFNGLRSLRMAAHSCAVIRLPKNGVFQQPVDQRLLIALPLLLASCATEYVYDPNEKIEMGRIVEKIGPSQTEIEHLDQEQENIALANAMSMYGAVGYAVHAMGMELPTDPDGYQTPETTYKVFGEDNRIYTVKDRYPDFEVGDCVKLFVSQDTNKYPLRIARGFECRSDAQSQ